MGLNQQAGAFVYATGTDGKEYAMPVLSMKQIGQLSGLWMGRLRDRFKSTLNEMRATVGQQLLALRDFEMNEPSFSDTCHYAVTPAGIDDVLRLASGLTDVDVLGDTWTRKDLASQLVGLAPVNPRKVEALPDPTPGTPQTESATATATGV